MYPRIRAFREDNDLTQEMIAKVLGMSQTGYSKYETGENDIPTSVLLKLSFIYDTNIDYLLGKTDYSKSYPINTKNKSIYAEYKRRLSSVIGEKNGSRARHRKNDVQAPDHYI